MRIDESQLFLVRMDRHCAIFIFIFILITIILRREIRNTFISQGIFINFTLWNVVMARSGYHFSWDSDTRSIPTSPSQFPNLINKTQIIIIFILIWKLTKLWFDTVYIIWNPRTCGIETCHVNLSMIIKFKKIEFTINQKTVT